jgi:hypothetical protein
MFASKYDCFGVRTITGPNGLVRDVDTSQPIVQVRKCMIFGLIRVFKNLIKHVLNGFVNNRKEEVKPSLVGFIAGRVF